MHCAIFKRKNEVLRLLIDQSKLNPIELIWDLVKSENEKKNIQVFTE